APAHLARHSLAQALSVLKEKVGREHLVVQRATVALVEGALDADVAHLDACDLQIRGAFLDGFDLPAAAGFEQWKDEWRAQLTPRIRDCLVKQMDAGRRIGDFATVERQAQVLHDLDPVSEDAVRGLMEARAWVGDRTNALKAYARFEQQLTEELGAKPSPELVRIADLLRQGRRPGRPPEQRAEAAQPSVVSERHERRFEAETLIGREQPFAQLYDAWLEVRRADSLLKAVEAATDEGPLVLVVDDVHAADNASAAILHMVARKLPRTRLLLILTGRTNELRTAAAPSALVSDTTVQALQGLE